MKIWIADVASTIESKYFRWWNLLEATCANNFCGGWFLLEFIRFCHFFLWNFIKTVKKFKSLFHRQRYVSSLLLNCATKQEISFLYEALSDSENYYVVLFMNINTDKKSRKSGETKQCNKTRMFLAFLRVKVLSSASNECRSTRESLTRACFAT